MLLFLFCSYISTIFILLFYIATIFILLLYIATIFIFQLYIYIFKNVSSVNYGALIIGVVAAVMLYVIKYFAQKYKEKLKFPIPAELIVVRSLFIYFLLCLNLFICYHCIYKISLTLLTK